MIRKWSTVGTQGQQLVPGRRKRKWERLWESEMVRKSEMVPKPQCAPVAKWQRFCTALLQKSQYFEKKQKIHFNKCFTSSGSLFMGWISDSANCNLIETKLVDSVPTLSALLGKGPATKWDDFLEKFQTAFDPLPVSFGKLYCNFFYNEYGRIYAWKHRPDRIS